MHRLCSLLLWVTAVFCIVPGTTARTQVLSDETLRTLLISTVITHDLGIPIGLLPFPLTQLTGETLQFVGNIGLKAYRPLLTVPDGPFDVNFYPDDDGDTDDCSFNFYLPNSSATFENMFGIVSIRSPYYDETTDTSYLWQDRWGVLPPPYIYHANSTARLSVRSLNPVRRWDDSIGAFIQFDVPFTTPVDKTEWYYPILDQYSPLLGPTDFPKVFGIKQSARLDRDGQLEAKGPQQVYLPVGTHTMEWTAATQLNSFSDVIVPGVLLGVAVLTELKNAKAGVKMGKMAKEAADNGDDLAKFTVSQADSIETQLAKRKYNSIWEHFITRSKPGPIGQQIQKAVVKKFVGVMSSLIDKVIGYGVGIVEAETGALLEAQGRLTPTDRRLLDMIFRVGIETGVDLGTDALRNLFINSDYTDGGPTAGWRFVIRITIALLQHFGLEEFVQFDTGISRISQQVIVWDKVPPHWGALAPLPLEATDFGGTRRFRAIGEMQAKAMEGVSFNCGRPPELTVDAPELLPLGETIVTWTAKDAGPNPNDGQDYAPMATQTIIVVDSQPPLLLAPPSKVYEVDNSIIEVPAGDSENEIDIGDAVAVDLADVQPTITNDAPALFLRNSRTAVNWIATDGSGNASDPQEQLITVKTTGENSTPVGYDTTAVTITAEEVNIPLRAEDFDELNDRFDPLWFKIEQHPDHGKFVAPLYPFFIEDYRTRPNDALGEAYDPETDILSEYIKENFCRQGFDAPLDFVDQPRYVHVTDDGIRYVIDQFYTCGLSDELPVGLRISKWTAAGEFLGQARFNDGSENQPYGDTFVVDRDDRLHYFTIVNEDRADATLQVFRCDTDFDASTTASDVCTGGETVDSGSDPNHQLDPKTFAYARVDSAGDIIYVADATSLIAFKPLSNGGLQYLGELGPRGDGGAVLDKWFGHVAAIEVGADSSVYVADVTNHRIHKLGPITVDAAGASVLGEYVGWSGRCTGSGNKACDDTLGRSRGYSCTFEPKSCTPTLAELDVSTTNARGAAQGQFDTPKFIAIDPNDVLYIADYGNERVQRLSPDGSFAGEAVSEGSGINKGDRPSFVLGNMGAPESLSVNSSQFYVVNRSVTDPFVHVFGTLPFKDITDSSVTVTYVSDHNFPNPNDSGVDTFTFSATDGLAVSDPATVSVTVSRNFRPPVAIEASYETPEDTELVDFELPADDPDGIADRGDFLGLDTLTWTVTTAPLHGTLSGDGAFRTYKPYPDYYGEDSLSFRVNDGHDDSNVATISIGVLPVNDPPVLTLELPDRIARGFPALITSTFTDDPSDGYEAGALWGDGTGSDTGRILDDDGENPRIEGIVVAEPPMPDLEGRTFAEHTWLETGTFGILFCLTDSGNKYDCKRTDILVEPLVSMGIGGSVYDGPLADDEITKTQLDDDAAFTYELTIINEQPESGPGLTAQAVKLDATLPDKLAYGTVTIDRGNCSRNGTSLMCGLGDLEPGAEVTLTIETNGPGNLIYDEDFDVVATLSTTSDALQGEMEFLLNVELLADMIDTDSDGMSDAYEQAYGLDPNRNDAGEDADGDGLDNLREFELRTSPLSTDSDGDGLSDFDEDMVYGTDPASADTDEDLMPDGWELDNGFDPLNAIDGNEDEDDDGRTNGEEYEHGSDPFRDDIPPELTIPPDIRADATGVLTEVDIGVATATDGKDGDLVPMADNASPFPTGPNVVTWTITDAAGNTARATQRVDVVPIVNFAIDQTVPEEFPVQVVVELNGLAVEYPVVIPYTVGGTASNPDDHNAADGTITIASSIRGVLDIDIVRDRNYEPDETLTLTMGEPVNAVAGVKTTHTITIAEPNVGPIVTITAWQNGRAVTTVAASDGPVSVVADIVDFAEDSHVYDWSYSDAGVTDPADLTDDGFQFDPAGLAEGVYRLRLAVTDDGTPVGISDVETLLKVVANPPDLDANRDSDGDGLDDAAEGAGDADSDRIPDYLDDVPNSNMLRIDADGRMLETETGLALRLGANVFAGGGRYAGISEASIDEDPGYGFPSGAVDFEITGLVPDSKAIVVVPLKLPIPAGAVYRKYVNSRWLDFVVDDDNAIASAPGADGACPPPGSDAYVAGLVAGFGCVQLTLRDGGPNDADWLANGIIRDPGGLAVPIGVTLEALSVPDSRIKGAGSALLMHLRLHCDSGDIELSALTLDASGSGNDRQINAVQVLVDLDRDGVVDPDDPEIGTGRYDTDDGHLQLTMPTPYEIPAGGSDLLVVYDLPR